MTKKEFERLSICLDERQYKELRKEAGAAGVSMSELVRILIGAHFVECERVRVRNLNSANPKQP